MPYAFAAIDRAGLVFAIAALAVMPFSGFLASLLFVAAALLAAPGSPDATLAGPGPNRVLLAAAAWLGWTLLAALWAADPLLHAYGGIVRVALPLAILWASWLAFSPALWPCLWWLLIGEACAIVLMGLAHSAGLVTTFYGLIPLSQAVWPGVLPPYAIDLVLLPDPGDRLRSLYVSPLALGVYLATILPIAVDGALGANRPTTRILALAASAVIAVGLVLTQTRNAWIWGMAAVVGVIAVRRAWRTGLALAAAGLAGAGAVALLAPTRAAALLQRLASIPSLAHGSNTGRLTQWSVAWDAIAEHPLQGTGIYSYFQVLPHLWHSTVDLTNPWPHLHNLYLQLALESGLIGLACFLGVVAAILFSARRQLGPNAGGAALFLAVVAMLGMGLLDFPLYEQRNAVLFWALLGTLLRQADELAAASG